VARKKEKQVNKIFIRLLLYLKVTIGT